MELLLFGTMAMLGSQIKSIRNTPKPEYRVKPEILKYDDTIPDRDTDRYENLGFEITNENEIPFNPTQPSNVEDINPIYQNSPFVPFFRSEKSQNTNNEWKRQRLNTFTGMNNIEFEKKHEIEKEHPSRTETEEMVNGFTFNPDYKRYEDFFISAKNNNVRPFEQEYVGPGLGVTTDTPASGGYHQMFRILPDNVNGYRRNNFGGDIITGKHMNDEQTSRITELQTARRTNEPVEEYRGFDAMQSSVLGTSQRPNTDVNMKPTHRSNNNHCITGILAGGDGSYTAVNGTDTRKRENGYATCVNGNPHSQASGVGAYTSTGFVMKPNERDNEHCQWNNVNYIQGGTYNEMGVDTSATQRGEEQCNHHNIQSVSVHAPHFENTDYVNIHPTQREFTQNCNYTGNPSASEVGYYNKLGYDYVQPTMRGICRDDPVPSTGPAMSSIPGTTMQNNIRQGVDYNNTRELTLVTDHVPNTQRTDNITIDGSYVRQTVTTVKADENIQNIQSNGFAYGQENYNTVDQLGETIVSNRVNDVINERDFGYIPSNNPFVRNINYK